MENDEEIKHQISHLFQSNLHQAEETNKFSFT